MNADNTLGFIRVHRRLKTHNHYPCIPNMGECRVSRVFPFPRYICTPQGRHGSKLRTALMMSMPRKLSGPFSSKMGVFCTASSYGPGVPWASRGLAFHGVGG